MIRNRSVPADTVLQHITYQDVAEALAWLTRNFGFKPGQNGERRSPALSQTDTERIRDYRGSPSLILGV
jgi:hypothetical protein